MKTIGILQPGYLPWLGFFEQMLRADIFVLYDDVQFDKNGWRNRNRIKTPNGPAWLTVPVLTKGKSQQLVNETLIDNKVDWRRKHLKSLEMNYRKAPYFDQYFPIFEKHFSKEWESLMALDMAFIQTFAEILEIRKPLERSSALNISGDRIERLIRICQHFGADVFYEGEAGKDYISAADFDKAGIKIEFQHYEHPVYQQLYGDFISHLSIVDLLFNHGNSSKAILMKEKP